MIDWDGDGLMDLVEGEQGPREKNDSVDQTFCLYRRRREADGSLSLGPGEPFRDENGVIIRRPIPYIHGFEVADWNGDGRWDFFTNEGGLLYVYENIGSNAAPRFRRKTLNLWGEPIRIGHHETSLKAIDWDHSAGGSRHLDLICGGESGWTYFFRRAALDAPIRPVCQLGPLERR